MKEKGGDEGIGREEGEGEEEEEEEEKGLLAGNILFLKLYINFNRICKLSSQKFVI